MGTRITDEKISFSERTDQNGLLLRSGLYEGLLSGSLYLPRGSHFVGGLMSADDSFDMYDLRSGARKSNMLCLPGLTPVEKEDHATGEIGGQVQVILELVDEAHRRMPLLRRDRHPALSGGPQLRHHQRPEQCRRLRAEQTLGEGDQQDLAFGEHGRHVEGRVGLADHGSHPGPQQERSQLVHHRGDRLVPFSVADRVEP